MKPKLTVAWGWDSPLNRTHNNKIIKSDVSRTIHLAAASDILVYLAGPCHWENMLIYPNPKPVNLPGPDPWENWFVYLDPAIDKTGLFT